MLRKKRVTPVRRRADDDSKDNPLHGFKERFIGWTTAVGLSDQTAITRRSALEHFIRWCDSGGIGAAEGITRDVLEVYQTDLAAHRKANGDGLERGTQVSRLNALKAFCKWLVRTRVVESDPSRELELPRLPRRLPRRSPRVFATAR